MKPHIWSVVLDCPDPEALATFYEQLIELPRVSTEDDQVHLDIAVEDMRAGVERAVELGARVADETSSHYTVPIDPAGHPFCLLQAGGG